MSNTNSTNKQDTSGHSFRPNGLSAARRLLAYIIRILVYVVVGVLICVLTFLLCERYSNIYILASEGMTLRAEDIVTNDPDDEELLDYFQSSTLDADEELHAGTYANYDITDHNYEVKIKNIAVLPWSTTATVTVVETMTVKGTYSSDKLASGETLEDHPLPDWPSRKLSLTFTTDGTRWYISGITVLQINPTVDALNTPDPNATALPMATPTPIPDPTPTPQPKIEIVG